MRGVKGEILERKNIMIFFEFLPFLIIILDIAYAIFRKVLVLETRNIY